MISTILQPSQLMRPMSAGMVPLLLEMRLMAMNRMQFQPAWLLAMYLLGQSKTNLSALELMWHLGG